MSTSVSGLTTALDSLLVSNKFASNNTVGTGNNTNNNTAGASGIAAGSSGASSASSLNAMGQSTFLQLMLAQIQNQDPTKPMDGTAFLSQLAQFSTVNGINQMQTSLASLTSALQSSQALQASTLVGRSVLANGNGVSFNGTAPVNAAVQVTAPTQSITVNVMDGSGKVVRTLQSGPVTTAGTQNIHWDGKDNSGNLLPAGSYVLSAQGVVNGQATALTTLVPSQVESVSLGAAGSNTQLNLANGTSIGLDAVREVL